MSNCFSLPLFSLCIAATREAPAESLASFPRVNFARARARLAPGRYTGNPAIIPHFSISFSRLDFYATCVSMRVAPRIAESHSREQMFPSRVTWLTEGHCPETDFLSSDFDWIYFTANCIRYCSLHTYISACVCV